MSFNDDATKTPPAATSGNGDTNGSSGSSIVKHLLFPSFADAGSNDYSTAVSSNTNVNNDKNDSDEYLLQTLDYSKDPIYKTANNSGLRSSPSVCSDATTAVHNNQSSQKAVEATDSFESKQPQQQQQHLSVFPSTQPPRTPFRGGGDQQQQQSGTTATAESGGVDESGDVFDGLLDESAVVSWQEEARPDQTAFAKTLLFRERPLNSDDPDEVLSTASEMGTVIGSNVERCRDLDHDFNNEASSSCSADETAQQHPSLQANINSLLQEPKSTSVTASATAVENNNKMLHNLHDDFNINNNNYTREEKKMPDSFLGEKLTSIIKRIGSGLDAAASAPNTPRKRDVPSSFLLRSPGSSARVAAKQEFKNQQQRHQQHPNHKNNEKLLQPRLESTTTAMQSRHRMAAFYLPRACFSFDAYTDTTMDDDVYSYYEQRQHQQQQPLDNTFNSETTQQQKTTQLLFRGSQSWDVSARQQPATAAAASGARTIRPDAFRKKAFLRKPPMMTPMKTTTTTDTTTNVALHCNPARIGIEREDALDILSCLVERGISLKYEDCLLNMDAVVTEWKARFAGNDEEANVLDVLVKSHEYALEMHRVSKSASSWLKSIGRLSNDDDINSSSDDNGKSNGNAKPSNATATFDITTLATNAMLHAAQMEAMEMSDLANRLNEELATCRAEIGRLRSAANTTTFRSPNRSILDESDEQRHNHPINNNNHGSFDTASPIFECDDDGLDVPIFDEDMPREPPRVRSALKEAKASFPKLRGERLLRTTDSGVSDKGSGSATSKSPRGLDWIKAESENFITEWKDLDPPLPPPPDHALRSPIVAAVLESWTDDTSLHESLLSWIEHLLDGGDPTAIPPLTLSSLDHQVRDGLVMHVIPLLLRIPGIQVDVRSRSQRTTTYDLAVTVDPVGLFLPSLDTTRRHFHTPARAGTTISTTNSSTYSSTTALISNKSGRPFTFDHDGGGGGSVQRASSRMSYDEMADGHMDGTPAANNPSQGMFMSALGGALGGFLSLRKGQLSPVPDNNMHAILDSPSRPNFITTERPSGVDMMGANDNNDSNQPYHRVVAAPCGRLGITFVEYRGHAMVSDVSPQSPLVGWIFPSDVLIAIDERPVSGMRVRDIIVLLKERADKPRALRVISSHDMAELTLNTSSIVNDGSG